MFKKWWVILIQGILLFILGIYIFNNPVEVLAGLSLWFAILTILSGITGVLGWVFGGKVKRESVSLLWSAVTLLFGIFVLMNLLVTMKAITMLFGVWVLLAGFSLINTGWSVKKETFIGWLILIIGIFSVIAGFSMIFNMFSGADGVAIILGVQVMLSGIALILLSFVKKALVGKVEDKVKEIKSKFQ